MGKKALITGINGQDGSYLAELLLTHGYKVYGLMRPSSIKDPRKLLNIQHLLHQIELFPCTLEDYEAVCRIFEECRPDECYHLAASTFVNHSSDADLAIMTNNLVASHHILLAILNYCPTCRLYFAGSSEIFGTVQHAPQNEQTPFRPRSVYGISKMASHSLLAHYRHNKGLYACTGFLYNHESKRRGSVFVTRKITAAAAAISLGLQDSLSMGNLDARRDWGYAPEYADAMYRMLQADAPRDYVIATGQLHTVRDILEIAFSYVHLDYREYVTVDERFVRPDEAVPLQGDPSAIAASLGWKPQKSFSEMIEEMVEYDVFLLKHQDSVHV